MSSKEDFQKILDNIPQTLSTLKEEITSVGKQMVNTQLKKTNLVSREEFEEQQEILKAVVEKLNRLEKIIQQINQN